MRIAKNSPEYLSQLSIPNNITLFCLTEYLDSIYDDLTQRSKCDGVNIFMFQNLMDIPSFIAEKLLKGFKVDSTGYVSKECFTKGLTILYSGETKERIRMMFAILDFDNDGLVQKEDVKFFLQQCQIVSPQESFENIVDNSFATTAGLSLKAFTQLILEANSDLFFLFYYFVQKFRPYTVEVLEYFGFLKEKSDLPVKSDIVTDSVELLHPTEYFINYFNINIPIHGETFQEGMKMSSENDFTLYKVSKKGKILKCRIVIKGRNLFLFKYAQDSGNYEFKRVQLLRNTFAKKCHSAEANSKKIYPFQMITNFFTSQHTSNYFTYDKDIVDSFFLLFNTTTGFNKITNFYSLEKELKQTDFGTEILGCEKASGEKVLIKAISRNKIGHKGIKWEVDIFKLLLKTTHPGIIKAKDYYETDSHIFLVYEYLPNGTLNDYLYKRTAGLTPEEVINITSQLTDALIFLKRLGIAHRDIKPNKILVCENDTEMITVKLADFGFAKIISYQETASEWYGSLIFAAPEILTGTPYSHQVDVWSLGVTVYYLSYGIFPFDDTENDIKKIRNSIIKGKYTFPASKSTSSAINKIISHCLVKDYHQRVDINEIKNLLK